MIGILLTGSLRSPPYPGCAGLPPVQGVEQPVLKVESLIKR